MQARAAAVRVTRVALYARDASFPAIRSLVLGYLIPSFSFGILFWGRACDMGDSRRRDFQRQITRPLRVALGLPQTTHQLGTLTLSHVPTIASLVLREQLSHLARVCAVGQHALPADHPTLLVHQRSLQLPINALPRNVLAPSSLLATSIYLCASVYPRVCMGPSLAPRLPAADYGRLVHGPLPAWQKGVEYWEHKSSRRRQAATATAYPRADLVRALSWSLTSAQHLTPAIITRLSALHAHAEWEAQHHVTVFPVPGQPAVPLAAAPGPPIGPLVQHATTAPLTQCKPSPGLPPFLSHRCADSNGSRRLRARLLLGRERSGANRLRFAKAAERTSLETTAICSHCPPPASPSAPDTYDTAAHFLLNCPRHQPARSQLLSDLQPLGLTSALSLSAILVASPPPPPFLTSKLPLLLRATASFLATVAAERLAAGLLPLDTG